MPENIVIVRYGEIALKGKNRASFERRLADNIADCLKKNGISGTRIRRCRGRIFVSCADTMGAGRSLQRIFGIVSVSPALSLEYSAEGLCSAADELIAGLAENQKDFSTFRISAKRSDKSVPDNSMQIERDLGQHIVDRHGKKVRLKGPELDIGVEILDGSAYVFIEKMPGPGGLPLGIEGRVLALLDGTEASAKAAWMMMKRGCSIIPVALEGVTVSGFGMLQDYAYGQELRLVRIKDESGLDRLAGAKKAKALVMGLTIKDAAGLEKSRIFREPVRTRLPKLYPLIGLQHP